MLVCRNGAAALQLGFAVEFANTCAAQHCVVLSAAADRAGVHCCKVHISQPKA